MVSSPYIRRGLWKLPLMPQFFPDLRWGFIEASAQWVPWVVDEAVRHSGAACTSISARSGKKTQEIRLYQVR